MFLDFSIDIVRSLLYTTVPIKLIEKCCTKFYYACFKLNLGYKVGTILTPATQ